jgi:hypothetical protein
MQIGYDAKVRETQMSCSLCDLCQKVPIRTPGELRKVVRVARANLEDGTIVEIASEESTPLSALRPEGPLPDIIRPNFRCRECGQMFLLRCETYHGSGGSWSYTSWGPTVRDF